MAKGLPQPRDFIDAIVTEQFVNVLPEDVGLGEEKEAQNQ